MYLPRAWRALYLLPLAFMAAFYFYPLLSILQLSLLPGGQPDLSGFRALVERPYLRGVVWFTVWQAAVSTLLTLLLGLPAAYIFAHFEFPGKGLLRALTTIPFVMPTVVVGAAFTTLLGPRGVVNDLLQAALGLDRPPVNLLYTLWIILLAHVFYNATVVVRIVGDFWANLDPRLGEAAAVLGADRWRVLREVTLPLLLPPIAASSLLVFLFCFTSFGVILILGGPRFSTLEVEIYRQAVNYFNLPLAAVLSLVQLVITFAVMAAYTRLQARTSLPLNLRPRSSIAHRPANAREWLAVGAVITLLTAVLVAPLAALAVRSVTLGEGPPSLRFYQALTVNRSQDIFFVPPVLAIRNSLVFSAAATVLSLALGLISAYLLTAPGRAAGRLARWLDPILLLPLGTSAVTLGFGYIVALGRPPLNLRTSLALVPLAYTLIAMPFVVRTLLPALRRLDPGLREAAATLGASPTQVVREVDLPLIWRGLLVAAVFAFTISLGEFGATLLLYRPAYPTMSVVIYRALGQPGLVNYGQALAMSTLLMLVCLGSLLAIERFRVGGQGEF
ncbi:MAG: iron ABC transporter permease [Caldilineales bacterium]|nr:iron ABC transporter permease [Caldilineales bacterium]MDW8317351.1 iron ABC transporter permease [Anaerolineae bacterium]